MIIIIKVSERPIEQVKDILTGASRYGKRGKYTLKDILISFKVYFKTWNKKKRK